MRDKKKQKKVFTALIHSANVAIYFYVYAILRHFDVNKPSIRLKTVNLAHFSGLLNSHEKSAPIKINSPTDCCNRWELQSGFVYNWNHPWRTGCNATVYSAASLAARVKLILYTQPARHLCHRRHPHSLYLSSFGCFSVNMLHLNMPCISINGNLKDFQIWILLKWWRVNCSSCFQIQNPVNFDRNLNNQSGLVKLWFLKTFLQSAYRPLSH